MLSREARATYTLLLALCAYLWALPCSQASADYDALVAQALAAQERSEFELAHRLFVQAHALAPNARTLRGMGVASYREGAFVRAIAELEAALVHPDKELTDELRSAVETLRRRALGQVGILSLQVLPRAAQVSIDDVVYGGDRVRILLVPGTRTLRLSAAGYAEQRLEVQVVAGMAQSLSVTLPVDAAASTPVPAVAKAEDDRQHAPGPLASASNPARSLRRQRSLRAGYALIGLTAAAGISAGSLAGAARGRVSDIADACRQTDAEACSPAQKSAALEDAQIQRFERSINALLGVGGAALVGAVALLSFGLTRELELEIAIDAQGMSVTGAF